MPDPAPSAPDSPAARSWVWHATLASRDAGQVSVLACVETLFAVALYWWIAIRWDTHWHLLSSVFIAPLLLLRSPESMKLGVQWFLKDWFGLEGYEEWPSARRRLWMAGVAAPSGLVTYAFARWLCELWLVGQAGWALFGWSALIGCVSVVVALATAIAYTFAVAGASAGAGVGSSVGAGALAGGSAGVIVIAFAVGVEGAGAFAGAVGGMAAVVFALATAAAGGGAGHVAGEVAFAVGGAGPGVSLRSLALRLTATLRHLPQGLRRLPENWQENNFWIDSTVPPELMPGIRKVRERLAFDGLVRAMRQDEMWMKRWMLWPSLAFFFFLPAFLYRLNIKATCWFWWPLAYLLKPVPQADHTGRQKQALCWPWDNPLQMLLILLPALLVLGILIVEYCDFSLWKEFKNAGAVPIPLKVALGMGWTHIPPWHWALMAVEVTGLGMLSIAGNARSHRLSDNWDGYAQSGMSRDLWFMDKLIRLRSLAAKALMLLGLGMCLISFPEWRQHLPAPLLQRLERFYHVPVAP